MARPGGVPDTRPVTEGDPTLAGLDSVDPAALARAEAALRALSGEFPGWMADELAKLEEARARLHAEDGSRAAWDQLLLGAHDLKGLGATYGHPLATRICASLCRLLDDPGRRPLRSRALVDAHVDAVRATTGHPPTPAQGAWLCEALEARVNEALAIDAG